MANKQKDVMVDAASIPAKTKQIVKRWLDAGFEFGQMAAVAKRSRSTIWRWMHGERTPRPDSWVDFINRVDFVDVDVMQRKVKRNG